MKPVDVGSLMETGRSRPYLILLIALTALAVVFDGADLQLLSVAIPSLMKDWKLERSAFANIIAVGLVGMMIGGALAGVAGDRLGRKVALLLSVLTFGIATVAMSAVNGLTSLGALRFVAGLGLGGAMPNAAALVAEFVPKRQRAFVITLTIVCVPVGGMATGYFAGQILNVLNWRWLFVLGGLVPLACLLVQFVFLAESPRYLARHPARWPELVTFLRRMGHDVAADSNFIDATEQQITRVSVGALFTTGFWRDTLSLWVAFVACMLAFYSGINWIPSLLHDAGWQGLNPTRGILYFNFGGVIGAILASLLITRLGSKSIMLSLGLASVVSAIVLSKLAINANASTLPVLAMLTLAGAFINALMVATYALAAHIYPTAVRATGVGTAVSVGRVGAVLSAGVGSYMLGRGGYPYFFNMIAGAMLICGVSLAFIQRHIHRAEPPA